ncbi:MAG: hypothetical protein WBG86_17520 [Polyangiales bacterium]
MSAVRVFISMLLCVASACGSHEGSTDPDPVALGQIRVVDPQRLEDSAQWGPALDLDLETEFWDLIGNSAHADYPAWHTKAKAYLAANGDADPRLGMLVSAGAVFSLTRLFQATDATPNLGEFAPFIADATEGARTAVAPLTDHEPAVVFFHNNQAMLAFLLQSNADVGICHLEKLRNLEDDNPSFHGTEGRAAAPFTYGMVNDEAYVDYAIAMMEDCNTWICNWTSKLAPYKPIGQLMTLAEFHAVKAELSGDAEVRRASYEEMNRLLDRATALGEARDFPFLDRIETLREELPARSYTQGIGMGRSPMPIYANETNCSNCHIGGIAGRYGEALDDPYPDADTLTTKPGPPPFATSNDVACD